MKRITCFERNRGIAYEKKNFITLNSDINAFYMYVYTYSMW